MKNIKKLLATVSSACVVLGMIAGPVSAAENPEHEHTPEVIEAVPASCNRIGATEGSKCSVCDEILVAPQVIYNLPHTIVDDEEVPATCTEDGKTAGKHCSVCGLRISGLETIPATGHTEVDIPATESTCTTRGTVGGTKCSVCDEILEAPTRIPVNGHNVVETPAVEPTVDHVGLTMGYHCSVCGVEIVDQEEIPKLAPAAPTPDENPAPTPETPAPVPAESGVAGFVERLYTVALGRNSEPAGKANWIAAIKGGETGADAAKGFLFSDEFLNKSMSENEFVTILYRTFFDREPDAAGLNAWVAALQNGESKQDVIMGFIDSTEWANVCLKYGIASGGTGTPSITVEPNESVIAFATRLYTTCLKRDPDQNGLMAWARQLANLKDTGSNAAYGFFFSDEMNSNPVSNEEFVTRLYLTFMDRQPDQGGIESWLNVLELGASREDVFNGFAQSSEFGAICANYGIIR